MRNANRRSATADSKKRIGPTSIATPALLNKRCWTINLESSDPVLLGKGLPLGVITIQNDGPSTIRVVVGVIGRDLLFVPDEVHTIPIEDYVFLAVVDGRRATVHFQLLLSHE
jgi:hypothetical protein